jgi:hypothetical protein
MKNKIERPILNITKRISSKYGFLINDKLIEKNRFVPSTILALKLFEKPVNEFFLSWRDDKVKKNIRINLIFSTSINKNSCQFEFIVFKITSKKG